MQKILVIEDNPRNMKLVTDILRINGFKVLEATNAETGMALARDQQPELILMDIQLPGIDGLTASQTLKQDPHTANIKILALTALAMPGDKERIEMAGCDDYISKPFSYKILLKKIAELTDSVSG